MVKNEVILITDEFNVPIKIHLAIKKLLKSPTYSVQEKRYDTNALGGMWHESGVIIEMAQFIFLTAMGQLLVKTFNDFVNTWKQLFKLRPLTPFYFKIKFKNGIILYFQLDNTNHEKKEIIYNKAEIKGALEKIQDTVKAFKKKSIQPFLHLLGDPDSIILKYDFESKRWLIYKTNSLASIFLDNMPFDLSDYKTLK
jgi:hypothetical protein